MQIYLTGSSAKLLSKEIATSLRGRSIAIEVLPYSFTEFLRAKQISFAPTDFASKKNALFNDYIHEGGFPEITNLHLQDRIRILQDYVNVVVFRDVIERHKIEVTPMSRPRIEKFLGDFSSV